MITALHKSSITTDSGHGVSTVTVNMSIPLRDSVEWYHHTYGTVMIICRDLVTRKVKSSKTGQISTLNNRFEVFNWVLICQTIKRYIQFPYSIQILQCQRFT